MSGPLSCPNCERLQRRVDDLEIRLAETQAKLAETQRELAGALREVKALRARVGQTSRNSNRPPSSDPPWISPLRRPPSGRKPGGQPGHEGHGRDPLPPDRMDEIRVVKPSQCKDCGASLSGADPHPRRHQVAELPKRLLHWVEYSLHTLVCPRCGARTAAELPKGVPSGVCGPRLQAFLATLTGMYRLSKRAVAQFLKDWLDLSVSPGTISAVEGEVSAGLAKPVEEAHAYATRQGVANVDETGWFVRHDRAWLWVTVTSLVTVFKVHAHRSAEAAQELLQAFRGIVVSDRFRTYRVRGQRHRQLCWAHLIRDFEAFVDLGGSAAVLGNALLEETTEMFALWRRVRDRTLSRNSFRTRVFPTRNAVGMLLEVGSRSRTRKVRATCRDLLQGERAMWTFARVPGVEPTNNAAERALRPAVLWRKGCFGTQSERGNRFVERILTVAATLRQQRRNIADFMTRACEAALHHTRSPSLLPSRAMLLHAVPA